ncbi:MAG: NADH-quinone oxidoreductase subunit L [Armatimonadetes bacterium]|nr:NADH-quinone oxidoreductase subunit L [Armatimonadota bacterium]
MIIVLITRPWGKLSACISILAMAASAVVSGNIFLQRAGSLADPHHEMAPMELSIPWIQVLDAPGGLGGIEMGILIDNLSGVMIFMVCFIALLIQIYSLAYMDVEIHHFPTQGSASMSRFFAYMSLFAFSMLGLVVSNNLLQIYVFWELVGVCSYFLIGFWYFKKSAADACKKAFIVTKFADLGFLIGILMLGIEAGSFNFLTLTALGATNAAALMLIFCGAIGKSAQFPLQIWLPDAMEGPTPVSALIHAATMVAAGIYLVARMFPLYLDSPAAVLVAYIGAFTAFLAATIAVIQNDIKRVLAYSTVSQLGYMLAALGAGAMTAGVFHLITHAFFKALLFLGSGAVIVACHSNDMWTMGGLRKRLPFTHLAFFIGCLALAGIPPFAGFWSKDEIITGVQADPVLLALLLTGAFLTAFYVTRMYCIAFGSEYRGPGCVTDLGGPVPPPDLPAPIEPSRAAFGLEQEWTEEKAEVYPEKLPPACLGAHSEHGGESHHEPHEVSPLMYGPLLILAIFAAFLGFVGVPAGVPMMPDWNWFHGLIHAEGVEEHEFNLSLMLLSIFLAVGGLVAGYALYGRDAEAGERRLRGWLGSVWRFLQQKWYMDHFWALLVRWTLFNQANLAAWFDDNVVDGAVRGLARGTGLAGDKLREEQTGKVQQYLLLIIIGVLVLVLGVGLLQSDMLFGAPPVPGGPL